VGFSWDFADRFPWCSVDHPVISFGPFNVDRTQGLRRGEDEIRITPKSLCVLWELASQAGRLVTKQQLFDVGWNDTAVSDSALTSCIQELRQALGDDPRRPRFIETLHRRGYRFVASVSMPDEPPSIGTDAQIIGRHHIVGDILDIWSAGERGARQVLFLSGEPGIGKTAIVRHVLERVTAAGAAKATWGQCFQHFGIGEPYQPLLEAIMRLCRQPGGAALVPILEKYAPTWLAQLPALLEPERYASLRRTVAGTTRQRMLRELTDALEAVTARTPLVLCIEDLHWSDPSTLDWIAAFAQRPEPARVLLIGTLRPPRGDAADDHPLTQIVDRLRTQRRCHEAAVTGLSDSEVADFIAFRFPAAPGQAQNLRRLAFLIHRHTGGSPLFVLNILDDLVARKLILGQDGYWALSRDLNEISLGTPDDVRRMIWAQLERLPEQERAVLEVASVAGETFSATTVAGAAGLAADDVEFILNRLVQQHRFLRQSGARFEFDHALYRDVLYDRVPLLHRAALHREVGEREEARLGERAGEIAAELAMHFEQSGEIGRAGIYLQRAAENAQSRSSFSEARMHFQKALALLEGEPASRERTEREISLSVGLGAAAMAARGWGTPEAETAYARARDLCRQLGESPTLFPAMWGLWLFYWGRGPLGTAEQLARELLGLAQKSDEDTSLLQAHHAAWATGFSRGDLSAACFHAREGIRLYAPERHAASTATYGNHDAGVCARLFLARASALLGRIEDAVCASGEAVALAKALQHPFSLALAHVFASAVAQTCRQPDRVRLHAAAATAIARDQDFRLLLAWAAAFEGWAAALAGEHKKGVVAIVNAIAEARSTGSDQFLPHLSGLAAEAHLMSGNALDGLQSVEDGLNIAARSGECFWEPELFRLRGELLIVQNQERAADDAEQAFCDAIARARGQGAMLLTLRATVSLGRLLRRSGRGSEAGSLIFAISQDLGKGEGLDLEEANALLGELTH
jgi:DNA-binding winged helix-turn-helix (wHTH) protein/predicted ATPase